MHGTLDLAQSSEQKAARDKAYSTPLADFNPGDPDLFRNDTLWPYFERLRKEDPVHYCKDSQFGVSSSCSISSSKAATMPCSGGR